MTKCEPDMITVDLDFPTRFEIVKAWHYVERYGVGDAQGRISRNGAGVHIRDRSILPAGVAVNEHHRRMAGDDPDRIAGDLRDDLSANQVLWNSPHEWTRDLDQLVRRYRNRTTKPPEYLREKKRQEA